jgi:hypothetical protein
LELAHKDTHWFRHDVRWARDELRALLQALRRANHLLVKSPPANILGGTINPSSRWMR